MRRKTPREELIESCPFIESESDLMALAGEYRMIFPPGKNIGTGILNRQSAKSLADALLRWWEYFQIDATREEILTAARKYNEDKKYDSYRQSSQYFIIKDWTKQNPTRGIESILANYIETARDAAESGEEEPTSNWVTQVV